MRVARRRGGASGGAGDARDRRSQMTVAATLAASAGEASASGPGLFTISVPGVFVGFEVSSKVSTILHTPLMSGANPIHGVILVGAMLILGTSDSRAQT